MDIVFQIRGKAVVRGADYCPTSTETEEMIRQMFMGEGIDIDVQVSDMYELTEIIETEDEPQTDLVKESTEVVKDLVKDTYICDTCKHFDEEPFSEACDKCFGDHNNWQPKDKQTDCAWK